MIYSSAVFIALFKGRKPIKLDINNLTDVSFLKSIVFSESQRLIIVCIISALLLSITYYFIAAGVRKNKIYIKDFVRGVMQYSIINIFSYMLSAVYYFIFAVCMGIISIPSGLIIFPLLDGKEDFFIPAIILWLITFLLIMFGFLLFNLYMTFWYPGIFLTTKNLLSAFKRSKKMVNDNFWKLLLFSIISILNIGSFLFLIGFGLSLLYKSQNPITHVGLWVGVIIVSLFGIFIKTYAFSFLYKNLMSLNRVKSVEQGIAI